MTTPIYPLAAPGLDDSPNGPAQIGALADTVETLLRRMARADAGLQKGVIGANDFLVTQHAAGANGSVDVVTNAGIGAYAPVDGKLSFLPSTYAGSVTNLAIAPGQATLPRVDRVILTGDVNALPVVQILTGAPTSGATLDNLIGAQTVDASAVLLADVHVPATDTTISNSQIRDRRPWARGARYRKILTAGAYSVSNVYGEIDATNLKARIECSGAPIEVTLSTTWKTFDDDGVVFFNLYLDDAISVLTQQIIVESPAGDEWLPLEATWRFTPPAGSHRISPIWGATVSTAVIDASVSPVTMTITEDIRPIAANNAVTSG